MLSGVPETALWTLYHRALAARAGVLHDPHADALVEQIDYPFTERFGGGELAVWQGLRVRAFDREVRRFLQANPDGTVVALGEGLETQLWRVDNGRVEWVSVELPELVALRRRLLPQHERQALLAGSALDEAWMEPIDPRRGLLITARGLLMYFHAEAVHALLATLARRFPGRALVFDVVPKWMRDQSAKPRPGREYQAPPWPYGVDGRELKALTALPGIASLERVPLPHGRGPLAGFLLPLASRLPLVRGALFSVLRATFS